LPYGRSVEARRAQVCSGGKIVIVRIAVCELAVAIGASRAFPGGQAAYDLTVVLCKCSRRKRHGGDPDDGEHTCNRTKHRFAY
jgi:hypothetical protein